MVEEDRNVRSSLKPAAQLLILDSLDVINASDWLDFAHE
jgi:hypothetical protein